MINARQIIELFEMKPLIPEGGYIKEFHFSEIILDKARLPSFYTSSKPICGTILYLITRDSFSRMHRLPTDEIYHFYLGDPAEQLQLLKDGAGRLVRLGQDIMSGEKIQSVAPADCWHGTRLIPGGEFALMGTTMAPAYTDGDYQDGVREELIGRYPAFANAIIERT